MLTHTRYSVLAHKRYSVITHLVLCVHLYKVTFGVTTPSWDATKDTRSARVKDKVQGTITVFKALPSYYTYSFHHDPSRHFPSCPVPSLSSPPDPIPSHPPHTVLSHPNALHLTPSHPIPCNSIPFHSANLSHPYVLLIFLPLYLAHIHVTGSRRWIS